MTMYRLIFVLFVGSLAPRDAFAQSDGAPSVDQAPLALYVGVAGGTIDVASSAEREADKKGKHIGFELSGRLHFPDVYVGAGFSYLFARVVGSGPNTSGEQEAQLNTSVYDVNLGYQFGSIVSTGIGLQIWASEGSNFAPKSEAAKDVKHWYGEIGVDPGLEAPVSIFFRYGRDIDAEKRRITVATLGARYQITD